MAYRLKVLAQQAGFRGLFAGLGPRMVMTAGLVSGPFLLYGMIRDGEWYIERFVWSMFFCVVSFYNFVFQPLELRRG